ncbi:MAG: DUF6311 domain-containing protein [Lachnospiraceae bacterium]|nr:DUF6311 domain-containing protein [Lachnospiraceae bacterium]
MTKKSFFNKHIKWYFSFILGALFGTVVFIALYGFKILDPSYEDWLLTGWYDLSQHYVGWKLYRASDWHFPIGLCDTSFHPYLASVIYTDSIPAWSFVFKLLSPILPETFQFFGIYGFFCFMMQGGVAKLLLRKVMRSEAECCLGCIPFVFCAPLWQRMYYHTALASHYLILIAIMLFIYRDRVSGMARRAVLWCVLGVVCVTTHITIYAIVSAMLLGFILLEFLEDRSGSMLKRIVKAAGFLLSYLFMTIFVFYLFGGFYGGISGESDGLGSYSANLNSLLNPIDYSRIIKELPLIECQYEGLSYIGIASIIMLIPATAYFVRNFKRLWKENKSFIISVAATAMVLWIVALSPKVTLNSHVLFEIPLPDLIYDLWSIFRASGRFLWPVMYAVILASLYFARHEIRTYYKSVLVLGCLLQLFEFSEKVMTISDDYSETRVAHFEADELDLYDWEGIRHLQFMHDYYFGEFYGDTIRNQLIGYTEFALRHGMTVSNFHFSRDDMDKVRGRISECERLLEKGEPEKDTVYIFRWEDISPEYMEEHYHNVRYIYTDEMIIALSDNEY